MALGPKTLFYLKLVPISTAILLIVSDFCNIGVFKGFTYFVIRVPELAEYKAVVYAATITLPLSLFVLGRNRYFDIVYVTLCAFLFVYFTDKIALLAYILASPGDKEIERSTSFFFFTEVQLITIVLIIVYILASLLLTHLRKNEIYIFVLVGVVGGVYANTIRILI